MKKLYNIFTKVSFGIVVFCLIPHVYLWLKFLEVDGEFNPLSLLILTSVILVSSTLAFLTFNELEEQETLKEIFKLFE